jgi:hypothetical protein
MQNYTFLSNIIDKNFNISKVTGSSGRANETEIQLHLCPFLQYCYFNAIFRYSKFASQQLNSAYFESVCEWPED